MFHHVQRRNFCFLSHLQQVLIRLDEFSETSTKSKFISTWFPIHIINIWSKESLIEFIENFTYSLKVSTSAPSRSSSIDEKLNPGSGDTSIKNFSSVIQKSFSRKSIASNIKWRAGLMFLLLMSWKFSLPTPRPLK